MKSVGRIAKKKAGYKQTRLGRIPVDWEYEEIGNRIDLLSGFAFESEGYATEGIRLLRGSNIKRGNTDWSPSITQFWDADVDGLDKYKLKDGDLVIAMDGSLVGRSFALLTKEDLPALLLQRVARIRSSKIDIGFLKEYIGSNYFVSYCDSVKTVTAIPHISSTDIKKFKIAIPPLPEQQKIARILSTWDKAIEKTEQLIEQKQQLKKGLMQQLLTGKVRFKEFVKSKKMKKTKLGLIPEDWEVRSFGELVDLSQYGLSIPTSPDGNYFMLKMNHFSNGKMISSEIDKVKIDSTEFKKYKINREDILFNRTNSYDLVGKTAIFLLNGNYTVASYIVRFVLNKKVSDPYFVNYFFNWDRSQMKLKEFATKGVSQSNINPTNLQKFFFLPTPSLLEQRKISTLLSSFDREIELLNDSYNELKNQKKGLMQQLLTGKIRVKLN